MKITTQHLLKALRVLSYIIFVGLCIQAGGFIFNVIYSMTLNPGEAKYFWENVDLSPLLKYDRGHFLAVTFIMIIASVLKAIMFYLIIKILHNKKLNMEQPFNTAVVRFILITASLALMIGFFCGYGLKYTAWMVKQGVTMPDVTYLRLAGADVWFFMGVVLLVVAQIFKRGIEIQTENELTV